MNRKAIIFGIKSYILTKKEKIFISKTKPWGIILFSRNIKNINQLRSLIKTIRFVVKDNKYPILIDQEGGLVSRLNKIINFSFYSQAFFGNKYKSNNKYFDSYYEIYVDQVCNILNYAGININTVPVLDILKKQSSKILKTRCFSANTTEISKLGKFCIKFYTKNKIGTVIKHMPGLGSAKYDSHYKTSIISLKKNELIKKDFRPFKNSKSFFGMTAHAIYKCYDEHNTATHSKNVINNAIRKKINFNGILISDDISMKALKYNLEQNAIKALQAGCNLVLHCNGNMKEMNKLAKVIPKIDKFTQKKTSHFYRFLR